MSIIPRLISIYRGAGLEPLTGYNPYHFNGYRDAPFTNFLAADNRLVGVYGLALQEVMFIEGMKDLLRPRNILVIGNAHGWSTLALALIFPRARVAALDPGEEGNGITNELARRHKLNVVAATGYSPLDVPALRQQYLTAPADLVLIDAIHENDAVLADFAAVSAQSQPNAVYVFHDVMNWNLEKAFLAIKTDNKLEGHILTRTPSGMAIAWRNGSASFSDYVSAFTEDPGLYQSLRNFYVPPTDAGRTG